MRNVVKRVFYKCKDLQDCTLLNLLETYIPLSLATYNILFKLNRLEDYFYAIFRLWVMLCFRRRHYKSSLVWLSNVLFWKDGGCRRNIYNVFAQKSQCHQWAFCGACPQCDQKADKGKWYGWANPGKSAQHLWFKWKTRKLVLHLHAIQEFSFQQAATDAPLLQGSICFDHGLHSNYFKPKCGHPLTQATRLKERLLFVATTRSVWFKPNEKLHSSCWFQL